jgi:hypothetical protein
MRPEIPAEKLIALEDRRRLCAASEQASGLGGRQLLLV